MAVAVDQDSIFAGGLQGSVPYHLIQEGDCARVLNARFLEGAITNAVAFQEILPKYAGTLRERVFASKAEYQHILERGDIQLVAPLDTFNDRAIIMVISGILFKMDPKTGIVRDITPADDFLPGRSTTGELSYLDNNGGISGLGSYAVIFNYPNRPIFINENEVRLSKESNFEVPPSRMGVTVGSRLFVLSASNLLYASDPFGGADPLAPLTFKESLDPSGAYYGQYFTVGSSLDTQYVTALARMPNYGGPSEEFLARNFLISSEKQKFIVAGGLPRASWEASTFVSYAGSLEGIAGPQGVTNIGDIILYVSRGGRIKTIGQDQERDTGLAESYLDDAIGQYLNRDEAVFAFRDWYRTLDHSRSVIKFFRSRLYASVYPIRVPAIDKFGEAIKSPSHRALAVGSIDPSTRLGPTAAITWEGFYDWMNPIGMITLGDDLYIVSKDEYGTVKYYKEDFLSPDTHPTIIYTRGYFASAPGKEKSLVSGELYFRNIYGAVDITVDYLVNNEWLRAVSCRNDKDVFRFTLSPKGKSTNAASIPLRIEIDHKGCRFELERVSVTGEVLADVKR